MLVKLHKIHTANLCRIYKYEPENAVKKPVQEESPEIPFLYRYVEAGNQANVQNRAGPSDVQHKLLHSVRHPVFIVASGYKL